MKQSGFKQKTYAEKLAKLAAKRQENMKKVLGPTKPRKPLKSGGFGKKKRVLKAKKDLMPNRIKRAKNVLTELSHTFVRKRDSVSGDGNVFGGPCCSCGKFCGGSDFQAGHWEADSTGGAILRYHPQNMHGQGGFCCNINRHGQQRMGVAYTMFMIKRYGLKHVEFLRSLKKKVIKADIIFFETMIELYRQGDEKKIVAYLHSL